MIGLKKQIAFSIVALVFAGMLLPAIFFSKNNTPENADETYFVRISLQLNVSEDFMAEYLLYASRPSNNDQALFVYIAQFVGTIYSGRILEFAYYYIEDYSRFEVRAISSKLLLVYGSGDDTSLVAVGYFSSAVPESFPRYDVLGNYTVLYDG